MTRTASWFALLILISTGSAIAETVTEQTIPVTVTDTKLTVDGNLGDWGQVGWQQIQIAPAIENDAKNFTGKMTVSLAARTLDGYIYLAARWPDKKANTTYKNWAWKGNRYRRGKELDDMFALRFEMNGDYDSCMLSQKDYGVDVWLWSAGRSNLSGYAEDLTHTISTNMIENAAEVEDKDGRIVYIKKYKDKGSPIYKNSRPKRKVFAGKLIKGINPGTPSGSMADVKAAGQWLDGHWILEMSRKLETSHADDIKLSKGKSIRGAIAVFNKSASEHKSNSGTLIFDLLP